MSIACKTVALALYTCHYRASQLCSVWVCQLVATTCRTTAHPCLLVHHHTPHSRFPRGELATPHVTLVAKVASQIAEQMMNVSVGGLEPGERCIKD